MAFLASFALNNAAAVAHTFTNIGKDQNGVMWFEQTTPAPVNKLGAIRIGYKQVRGIGPQTKGRKNDGTGSVVWTIAVPTLETLGTNDAGITPVAQIAYKEAARVSFDLPERGSDTNRDNVHAFTKNLLSQADVYASIKSLIPIQG